MGEWLCIFKCSTGDWHFDAGSYDDENFSDDEDEDYVSDESFIDEEDSESTDFDADLSDRQRKVTPDGKCLCTENHCVLYVVCYMQEVVQTSFNLM